MHPLDALMDRAELGGSRYRAILFGRREPQDRDMDFLVHAQDPAEFLTYARLARQLCEVMPVFRYKKRLTGVTATAGWVDISVYPARERPVLMKYWYLEEGGTSKATCLEILNANRRAWLKTAPEWRAVIDSA